MKAQPDGDLTVHFGSAILQPSPSSVSLTKGSPGRRVISIRPSHVGFHQMAVTLRGSAKDLYDKPKPLLGVVKPSSTSAYFEKRGLKKGILEPGCCTAKGVELKCPQSSHKVTVLSTCHWSTFFGLATTSKFRDYFCFITRIESSILNIRSPFQADFFWIHTSTCRCHSERAVFPLCTSIFL